jgi:predicted RNase H-like HicB family nuclease
MQYSDMNKIVLVVHVLWDAESHMFVATSDDIPGLVTEADSFEKLVERVKLVAPELLELNGILPEGDRIPLAFQQSHYESLNVGTAHRA